MRITAIFAAVLLIAAEPKPGKDPFDALSFRSIGPAAGGRVCRACGVPGDPLTYYAATAGGGVWKSSDGGRAWKSIFDDQPTSTAGSIAVAASDPNVVYVGSGEANIRGNVAAGNGIYRSTDAGKSWQHVWKAIGQIGTMIVHPTNPDIAFAAALGSPFGPGPERGVMRTTDGGKTWKKVLFKDDDTGAADVCFDPANPRILFAGLWQTRRKPWDMTSGGPGSGLYTSRDGGDSWTQLKQGEKGLPKGVWGKVGVAVSPADSLRVYAIIEANEGGLFRSDDGGETWNKSSEDRLLRQRAWYYTTITVDPRSPDVLYCPQVPLLKSVDGGANFKRVGGCHHGDHHDLWIDPTNPLRMIDANDGGVDITTDGGKTWFAPPLPIAQFYHVTADNASPYRVMGNMQDLGTAAGPSLNLSAGKIRIADWTSVGGGETGFAVADPSDPNIIYSGEYGGFLSRFDRATGQARNVSAWPHNPTGITPAEMKYRFQWTAPILISKHDPKTVYHAANVIFRTTDAGQNWTKVSGDLSRNEKSKQQWSGGPITGDNTGVEVFGTVFALAESPKQAGLLWAGSDDGLIHVSNDAGGRWDNVTANVPGLPDWATVRCVEPSPFDAGTAYLVAEGHRLNDFRPYLWKTADSGKTWTKLSDELPQDVYLHAVRCDPSKKGLLFVGTERGVVVSPDDGVTWKPMTKLPTMAVHDLVVKGNDLVVGSMGRSLWILDDLSPLREWSAALADAPAHLFAVQPATRWRVGGGFHHDETAAADNPPVGVVAHYSLAKKPAKPIKLEVLDTQDRVIFDAESMEVKDKKPDDDEGEGEKNIPELPIEPGLYRIVWGLNTKGPEVIPGSKTDGGNPKAGIPVPPGTYTIRLTVDGKVMTAKADVRPDPRVKGDLLDQYRATTAVRDEITKLATAVLQLRGVKKQLVARNQLLGSDAKWKDLVKGSKDLIAKLDVLEEKLHNPKAKVSYDIFGPKGGAMLYSQLVFAYSTLLDADGPPTTAAGEVTRELTAKLDQLLGEWQTLIAADLSKLNADAKALDLPTVMVPPKKSKD